MTTKDERPWPLCADNRHEDPDNSGLCIKCGGIMNPDAEDWAETPERCIGEWPGRDPLLSDEAMMEVFKRHKENGWSDQSAGFQAGVKECRDFYERLITEGKLLVVK